MFSQRLIEGCCEVESQNIILTISRNLLDLESTRLLFIVWVFCLFVCSFTHCYPRPIRQDHFYLNCMNLKHFLLSSTIVWPVETPSKLEHFSSAMIYHRGPGILSMTLTDKVTTFQYYPYLLFHTFVPLPDLLIHRVQIPLSAFISPDIPGQQQGQTCRWRGLGQSFQPPTK